MLIDTHAHLNFKDYERDLNKVIKRAVAAGVGKIICVSSNIADSERAIEIAKKFPGIVFAAVGIHPQQTDPGNTTTLNNQIVRLENLAKQKEVIAIGECGLDYSPAPPGEKDRTKKEQFFLFEKQIKLTQNLSLPLLIHSREAFTDTLEILSKYQNSTGVFHCYSGGKKGIEKVCQLGFSLGIAGNLTYDEGLQNVSRQIPLEKIVLETDCPFLSPKPIRGKRNEPANTKITARLLAKIKDLSFEKISRVTIQNAKRIFKI